MSASDDRTDRDAEGAGVPPKGTDASSEFEPRLASRLPGERKPPPQHEGEKGGPKGPEPTRFGDWEKGGRAFDF